MQKTIRHLTPFQQEALTQAIEKIALTTHAERIYCYGHRSMQVTRWSPFYLGPSKDMNATAHFYDLLLVMPDSDLRYREKVAALDNRPVIPFTRFYYNVMTNFELSRRLKNNDPFVCKVCQDAVLLHNTGSPGASQGNMFSPSLALSNNAALHWVRGINLARQSFRQAQRIASGNDLWLVLAHLHESARQTCIALIALYTGQRMDTQKLSHLLYYCDNFCYLRNLVFPCTRPEEEELLQSLERTQQPDGQRYIRRIPAYITEMLFRRIAYMHDLAEQLYRLKTGTKEKKMIASPH